MDRLLVGLDVGGTKLAVRVETLAGERLVDTTLDAAGWEAAPVAEAVAWISARLPGVLPSDAEIAAVGVGAQGVNTVEHAAELQKALEDVLPAPVTVVNDARLLVPAAGLDDGLAVISGTGAIGVGTDRAGRPIFAGGWGAVIGDDAGAAGIVRLATVAALDGHEDGAPDDGLLGALLAGFDVPDPGMLARTVNDEPTVAHWGRRAPAVFHAADAGSRLAVRVIGAAADHLALLVHRLVARGAVGSTVVAAGSVIVGQPRLAEAFRARVSLEVQLLTDAPVAGAVALARRSALQ
jgi:N-acetylglucosamine kinase-like BadF-type ATPase